MVANSHGKYEIFIGSPEDHHACDLLLARYPFKAYSYHQISPAHLNAYQAHIIGEFFAPSEGKQAILARENGQIVGILTWEHLEWDTAHFGFPCRRINHFIIEERSYFERVDIARHLLLYALNTQQRKDLKFIVGKIPSEDVAIVHALEICGFNTIETELVLRLFSEIKRPPLSLMFRSHYQIRLFSHEIPDGLSALYNIQTHDRFHRDPRFSQDVCDSLWNKSLKNSCAGHANHQIVMAFKECRPVAVVSICCESLTTRFLGDPIVSFFVVGVAPEHQKKGLGKWLVQHAIEWSLSQTPYIEVETQSDNYGALALYQNVGFQISFSKTILHKWL